LRFDQQTVGSPPVQTRTGADPDDPDSGGQPIQISCAFQYKIVPETLHQVYLDFGTFERAKLRWQLLSNNMVSNVAQQFTPQDFWVNRQNISAEMLRKINNTLWKHGYVLAVKFQIMKVDFADKFEDSITAVQVAEQTKVINLYEQQVQKVVQSINVKKAENQATIANISAGAEATAKTHVAKARRDAFNRKQEMKARKYKLQDELGLDGTHMAEYFKIKSLQAQSAKGKLVVGLPSVGETGRKEL
jgi:hypothetical protein